MNKRTLDYARPTRIPSRFVQYLDDRFDLDLWGFLFIVAAAILTTGAIAVLIIKVNFGD